MNVSQRKQYRWDFESCLDDQYDSIPNVCIFLGKEAARAYARGLYVSATLVAVAALESCLRARFAEENDQSFAGLLKSLRSSTQLACSKELHGQLEAVRQSRNAWVHVSDPDEIDTEFPFDTEELTPDLKQKAFEALEALKAIVQLYGWDGNANPSLAPGEPIR